VVQNEDKYVKDVILKADKNVAANPTCRII
jgi:hypothetical protein